MKIKDGVYTRVTVMDKGIEKLLDLNSFIRVAMSTADLSSRTITGKEITVTSLLDGKHKPGSKHYSGNAFDLRTSCYSTREITALMDDLKKKLGEDFDVVLETDHIHIEYDPR